MRVETRGEMKENWADLVEENENDPLGPLLGREEKGVTKHSWNGGSEPKKGIVNVRKRVTDKKRDREKAGYIQQERGRRKSEKE